MHKKSSMPLTFIYFLMFFLLFLPEIFAQDLYTFDELMKKLENHSEIKKFEAKAESIKELSLYKSSWMDPVLRIDALNFPVNNLSLGKSPMSGIALTVSQQFPLTGKYSQVEYVFKEQARMAIQEKNASLRELQKDIWFHLISLYRMGTEQSILNENISWLNQMIEVTSKRYSTGKATQEALLDLQVRKSELEAQSKKKAIEIERLWKSFALVLDEPENDIKLNHSSIPWDWLAGVNISVESAQVLPQEKILIHSKKRQEFELQAAKDERVPDITFGINYRYRRPAGTDPGDDFIGGFFALPIPINRRSSRKINSITSEIDFINSKLISVKNKQKGNLEIALKKLSESEEEYTILTQATLPLAIAQRDVTARNYRVGITGYISLLKSQLQLQELGLEKTRLEAQIKTDKINVIFESGANLTPDLNKEEKTL